MNRCLSKLARTRASNSGSRGSCCARDTSLGLCHRPPTEPASGACDPACDLRGISAAQKPPRRRGSRCKRGHLTLVRVTAIQHRQLEMLICKRRSPLPQVLTELRVGQHLVTVEELEDRAGEEGAENRLQAQLLREDDEEGKQEKRTADANLRRRVLQTHECRRDTYRVLGAEYDDGDDKHEYPEEAEQH